MERTNEMWVSQLKESGPSQAEAITDLRRYLTRGLTGYLRTRSDVRHLSEREIQQLAEDCIQEALLKIRAKLESFQGKSKFTTWATKIAINYTISELRRKRWGDYSLDAMLDAGMAFENISVTEAVSECNAITQIEQQQAWKILTDAINDTLSDRQRATLAAVHFDNIPVSEVARQLNTNRNNIYKILFDARKKLKKQLLDKGLEQKYTLNLFSNSGPGDEDRLLAFR